MTAAERASRLLALHEAPSLLTLVNVWDVASARVVASDPGTQALATASHAIAAAHGYEDGEQIPLDLHLDAVRRIVDAVDVPVTADLEAGYGDVADTVRRAIGVGVVGANIEDGLRPLDDAVRAVEAALEAGSAEGIALVLNARTDAFLQEGRPAQECLDDAVTRGRAYLAAGAPVVFVPGVAEEAHIRALVDAFGPRRLSVLGGPSSPTPARLEELGVARVSFGPWPQRVALAALQDLVRGVGAGEGIPAETPRLS